MQTTPVATTAPHRSNPVTVKEKKKRKCMNNCETCIIKIILEKSSVESYIIYGAPIFSLPLYSCLKLGPNLIKCPQTSGIWNFTQLVKWTWILPSDSTPLDPTLAK